MDVTTVSERLVQLKWEHDHTLFDQFASTLVLDGQQDAGVIFHLVDHHLDYGNFRRAGQILADSGRLDANATMEQLNDIDETLLAISCARLQLRRSINTTAARHLKEKLDAITTFDQGLCASDSEDTERLREQWIVFKLYRSLLWMDLRKTGHLAKSTLTDEVESWLGKAIEYLRARNDITARRLEFGILANFQSKDSGQQISWLQNLMSHCQDDSLEKTRATQLYALKILTTSRSEALSVLQECKNYYISTRNIAAQLVMESLDIFTDPRTEDRLSAYLRLSERCLDNEQFALARFCIDQAELHTRKLDNWWAAFEIVYRLAQHVFDITEDAWSANEYKVLRCCARAFSPPRDPADLRQALTMVEAVSNEEGLTPSQDHALWKIVGDCANKLMRYPALDQCERILLDHEYTKLNYEDESLIINDYSQSTHAKIVARFNQPLTESLRSEIYDDLQKEIQKLERSFDRDQQHDLLDSAKIKLQRLFMYYNTIDTKYPEQRKTAKSLKRSCYSRYKQYESTLPTDTLIGMTIMLDGFSTSTPIEIADRSLQIIKADPGEDQMRLAEAYLLCAVARKSTLDMGHQQSNRLAVLQGVMSYLNHSRLTTDLADSSSIYLMRITTTLLNTTRDLVLLDSANQAKYFQDVHTFLVEIERAITRQRGPSTTNADVSIFMENRRLESDSMRRGFYRDAENFFFKLSRVGDWWAWHERARSRTLNSRLRPVSGDDPYQLPINAAESEDMFSRLFASAAAMIPTLNLVIVDFYVSHEGKLSLIAIDSQERNTKVVETILTRDFVESWYNRVLDDPVDRLKNPSYLAELQPIAAAIKTLSTEDDLICLLPLYPLDRFPLHAACIGGKYLLQRNTIIHATSLTSLLHCFEAARSTQALHLDKSMVFGSAYPVEEEQEEILKSHANICKSLNLASPMGKVEKATFKRDLLGMSWIHYHGHVTSLASGPLDQGFVLHDGVVTVKEIMDQESLPKSAVIAIGCGSGAQDNNTANEQLGLSPVLINAGAVLVLSTLWKVDSLAGRIFSQKFYNRIRTQLKDAEHGEHFINVAEALKNAIADLRSHRGSRLTNERFVEPSHWAAYVMYGSPFFKIACVNRDGAK